MKNKRILVLVFVLAFLFLVGCYPSVPAKIIGIKVSPDIITMSVGSTLQLQVTGFFDDGSFGDVTPDCIYESSNSFIVIVNTAEGSEGKIIAKAPGKVTIVIVDSYEGIFTDIVLVTVREDIVQEETI